MAFDRLARFILLPAMLFGQDPQLSDGAQKLVNKPRLGSVRLTWTDGRSQMGRIVRVTDQFIAFETSIRPAVCEDVELSKTAAVQWLRTSGKGAGASDAAVTVLLGAVLVPSYIGNAFANPFKRISPPLKPLSGSWELTGSPGGAIERSLDFAGNTVQYRTITSKRGRWSVERDLLHLRFDGEPESVTSFHFDCGELILENPTSKFRDWSTHKRATLPIVGDWRGSNYNLDLAPDGVVTAKKFELLKGTFQNTATSLTIHWTDARTPAGAEWIAQIKNRNILVNVRGVPMRYHYVPPGLQLDL